MAVANPIGEFVKDPDAALDYTVDWKLWLVPRDTISSVAWTVGAGLTNAAAAKTTTSATIWLTGGTAGTSYDVTCEIVTTQGRTDDRTFRVNVEDR
jgi:hypothetical protein